MPPSTAVSRFTSSRIRCSTAKPSASTAPSAWRRAESERFFPSPLVGEGGSRRLRVIGARPPHPAQCELNARDALSHKGSGRNDRRGRDLIALSISGDKNKIEPTPKDPQRTEEFRETQYEWQCGRGDNQTGLSQDRMAGTRYRGRAAGRRGHRL